MNYLYYNFHDEEDDEEINSLRIDFDEDIRVGREVGNFLRSGFKVIEVVNQKKLKYHCAEET